MSQVNNDKHIYKEAKGYEFIEAEVQLLPQTMTKLTEPKQIEFMDKLIEKLEDLDDVQNVYHNWEQDEGI